MKFETASGFPPLDTVLWEAAVKGPDSRRRGSPGDGPEHRVAEVHPAARRLWSPRRLPALTRRGSPRLLHGRLEGLTGRDPDSRRMLQDSGKRTAVLRWEELEHHPASLHPLDGPPAWLHAKRIADS